jgi:hypothetical protein
MMLRGLGDSLTTAVSPGSSALLAASTPIPSSAAACDAGYVLDANGNCSSTDCGLGWSYQNGVCVQTNAVLAWIGANPVIVTVGVAAVLALLLSGGGGGGGGGRR